LPRCTPWPRMIVFRTVFGGISAAAFVLILIRDMKLWLQRLDIVSIHLGRDKWLLIAFVLGVCMLAAYRQSHVLTGMLRWATVSPLCLLAFAGVFYLSFLMSALIHQEIHLLPVVPQAELMECSLGQTSSLSRSIRFLHVILPCMVTLARQLRLS